ncbi:hypothetical protein CsatB_027856 [Cannabis sativa]
MAGEIVVGALVSASLNILLDKSASPYVVEFFKGKKHSSGSARRLQDLKMKFLALSAVLVDAEQKQNKVPGVKEWLDELKNALDDAEDLFGEIEYDALKLEIKKQEPTTNLTTKVCNKLSKLVHLTDKSKRKNELDEILRRLDKFQKQISFLQLVSDGRKEELMMERLPSTSLPDEPEVYGREADKDALMKLLMLDDVGSHKICVIPILGMGGIGKSTLAQTLFNDDEVQEMFEMKAWVCVSHKFDVMAMTKVVLQHMAPGDACSDMDLNLLQRSLTKKLVGKKFLIVLDDVWENNYVKWTEIMKPFNDGAKGSKIIVTTRNEKVANSIRTVDTLRLRELSEDECWEVFAKHASSGNPKVFVENPKLKSIGREIAKKCNGLPLAAKVLGGLLRSILDAETWDQIAKSNIWELTNGRSRVLPAALEVSYYYLPPHLKQCFAYCSIFPKGYTFERDELILLWIAENLVLHSEGNKRIEEVGYEYFDDLVSMSFFQLKINYCNESYFIMHDLIVDLARAVSGKYCGLLEYSEDVDKFDKKIRHLGCVTKLLHRDDDFETTHLRTLLSFDDVHSSTCVHREVVHNLLSKLKRLRVLSFRHSSMIELSDSIGELKHLRYLDLSNTNIMRLPKSFTALYKLETLKLKNCLKLETLPKDIHRLTNLRHLIISGGRLEEMPSQINKLMNLQTLTTFIVGQGSGAKLEELAELLSLRGKLSIRKLENVINITKASNQVNILEKKQLEKLSLKWSNGVGDSEHGEGVLDMLSPNTILKQLKIHNYPSTKLPNWIGDDSFCNIVHVKLWNCQHCSKLPPLGQLASLKSLHISGFDSVVTVGDEFYGNNHGQKPFSSLETLTFKNMSSWEQWRSMQTEDATTYGKLKTLEIFYCPKLVGDLPRFFPSLTKLDIHVDKKFALSTLSLPCVKEIKIGGLENTESLWEALKYQESMSDPTSFYHPLESLHLTRCGESFKSFHLDLFPNLKNLAINNCNYFEALSMSDEQCQELTSLSSLSIWCCPSFVSFPKGGLIAPKLTFLNISQCEKMMWLPDKMSLISLYVLSIHYKPLVSVMNWNLQTLSHITHVQIDGTGEEVESFPEEGLLPATITSLCISTFSKLRGLDKNGLKQLTFLQTLAIFSCPELQTLSEEGFSTSLRYLHIHGCPLLKKIYDPKSENRECWSKISHTPHIQFY